MSKIYTKTGDGGTTGTFGGRMSKSDQLAVALGAVDELNSWIGVCRSEILNLKFEILNAAAHSREWQFSKSQFPITSINEELRRIQGNLLSIGSLLAGSEMSKFKSGETRRLERIIDKLTEVLPKINNFIYPTGVGVSAHLQVARTVARRAEREVVALVEQESVRAGECKSVLKYLNRLSDALFMMARWVNFSLGGKEEVWLLTEN